MSFALVSFLGNKVLCWAWNSPGRWFAKQSEGQLWKALHNSISVFSVKNTIGWISEGALRELAGAFLAVLVISLAAEVMLTASTACIKV